MSNRKLQSKGKDSKLKLRGETLEKLRQELRRIATNGTMQGQRYASALFQRYPELRA